MSSLKLPENIEDIEAMETWGAAMIAHFHKIDRPEGVVAIKTLLGIYREDEATIEARDENELAMEIHGISQTILRENLLGSANVYEALIEPTKAEFEGCDPEQLKTLQTAVQVYEMASSLYREAADAIDGGKEAQAKVKDATDRAEAELKKLGVM